jgi:hypothetical protein
MQSMLFCMQWEQPAAAPVAPACHAMLQASSASLVSFEMLPKHDAIMISNCRMG